MKQINIRVDEDLAKRVYAKIATQKITLQSLIQGLLENWLNEDDPNPGCQTDNSQEIISRLNILEQKVNLLSNNHKKDNSY